MRVNMRKLQLLFPTKQNTIIGRYKSSPVVLTALKFFAKLTGKYMHRSLFLVNLQAFVTLIVLIF